MTRRSRLRTILTANGMLVGALLGALFLMAPTQAASALTHKSGSIVFSRESAGRSSIWKTKEDGSHPRKLAASGSSPAWSPDGNWVAYVAGGQIKIMSKNGWWQHDVTYMPSSTKVSEPVWSPDGKRLAFVRTVGDGSAARSAVFSVNMRGWWRQPVNVSGWSDGTLYRSPAWSPDGKQIAYEKATTAGAELLAKTFATGAVRTVTAISDVTSSATISWSPSGEELLFKDSENEIYTIHADGTRRAVISDGESYDATWSPDGKKIAFLEDFSGEFLSVSEEDGTVIWLPLGIAGYDEVRYPVWSPDGKKVLVTAYREEAGVQKSTLFSFDLQSQELARLYATSGVVRDAAWQPKR